MNLIRYPICILLLALAHPGQALNNIHFNSYNLVPSPIYFTTLNFSSGLYLDPGDLSSFSLPVSGALNLNPDFELGFGLRTRWGTGSDKVTHFVGGVKIGLAGKATIQGDLLLGMQNSANGMSVTYLKRTDIAGSRLYNFSQFKLGFMDHFTGDALFAFEAGFYPTLKIIDPLSVQLGFISSSLTGQFENNLAMDLMPTLLLELSGTSDLHLGLVMGLAGNRQSGTALHLVIDLAI